MAGLAPFAAVSWAQAAGEVPLELIATIPMPGVRGRIDHFSLDSKRHRLFVAALGNDTVEVLDLNANRHERSIPGFAAPQGLLYLPEQDRLYVAEGGGGRVDILDAGSLATVNRIGGLDDADNLRYDATRREVVVGYGNGALRVLDAATGRSKAEIALSGHPESFQLEPRTGRALVNVPDARQIAIVNLARRELDAVWKVSDARRNFPMALDETGRRLFVGARSPAAMLVYDADSGTLVARLPICGDTDDLFFDATRRRVYVVCGEGRVDIFRQESADRYVRVGTVETAPRARTGLFAPQERKLFVAAPAAGKSSARVLVYRAP